MPNPKHPTNSTPPTYAGTRTPHSALREIKQLRRLIRRTRRKMDAGAVGFLEGSALISRLSNSIERLLSTQHRIAPPRTTGSPPSNAT